jgi:hypothetical protein
MSKVESCVSAFAASSAFFVGAITPWAWALPSDPTERDASVQWVANIPLMATHDRVICGW